MATPPSDAPVPPSPAPIPPAAPPAASASVLSRGYWEARSFFAWIEDRLFPARAGPPSNPRGVLSARLLEWPGIVAALAIALVVAGLLEYTMLAQPVPAGGDPGQWTSTSYAYVGLSYPSWIIPGQYPPLLFPLLGVLVRLTGGPIEGARAYIGVVAVLLGLSFYFLARGLTRRRSTALLAEALIVLNPTFLQMFFWGFYPNLLGFVFLNLSLGFLVRFVRSRRPRHAFLFWSLAAATLLTHSLVGTVLVADGAIAFLLVLSIGALPREIFHSRAGAAGIAVFVGAVGGFYALTALLKIPHPNYFHSGSFAYLRNGIGSIFDLILHPFSKALRVAPGQAVPILWVLVGALVVYAVAIRVFWKSRLTMGTIVTLALALGPLALATVGWELAVVTDYGRFSYFLIAPIGLAIALSIDRAMTELRLRAAESPVPVRARPGTRAWRLPRSASDPPAAIAVFALAAVAVVIVSDTVSVRLLPSDEANTSKVGHDASFLGALGIIRSAGVPGSILTVPGVAKWTRAILVRDAYFPNLAARYTFDPTHLVDEETAYFAMTSRYAATNDLVAVTALGTDLASGNATFEYQPAYFGVFTPAAAIPVGNLSVRVLHNGTATSERVTSGAVVALAPQGSASFALTYAGTGFSLTVTGFAYTSLPEGSFEIAVTADPGYSLLSVAGNVTGPSAGTSRFHRGSAAGTFELTPGKFGTTLATDVVVQPARALRSLTAFNHPGVPAHAGFVLGAAGNGTNHLSVSFYFRTALASNLITGVAPLIVADTVWSNWTVRFVLYSAANAQEGAVANLLPNELAFLETEFGAGVIGTSGTWTVLLVPPAASLLSGPRPAPSLGPP